MNGVANLAVSSGFFALIMQAMFSLARSQSTLNPRISWIGAYGISACILLMAATLKAVFSQK